ncbi:hypothetical protein NDU88_005099 [Pleurodeles waltl]|uniref:Gypsy retrotransposon integrase-like protein 1 n=1 Tax=Pleurodeles waltl TaxID=8319 RepID=A0AAV7RHJ9_PLEWA|nr:hypothetical protein NDU88_005099 [Pleurodeles waltl]
MHGELVHNLLTALTYPKKLAIVKYSAHKKVTGKIGQGNALAGCVACETAMQRSTTSMYVVKSQGERWHNARQDVLDIQKSASVKEREQWSEEGELDDEGCWRNKQMDKWKLPITFVQPMVQMAHGLAHVGVSPIMKLLTQGWEHPEISSTAKRVVQSCLICLQYNPGKGTRTPAGGFATPTAPFEVLQTDYIQLERCNNLKYVLVVVCAFSKWIEAYPTKDNTAITTAKVLLK